MNLSRTLFSLLLISLLVPAVYSRADTARIMDDLGKFAPLGSLENSHHFKAAIHVSGKYYSGIILIKETPSDNSTHVVFLSELGLNILDLAYRNNGVEVVSVQDFLNRPYILKTLQNDFQTLLLDLSGIEKFSLKMKKDGVTEELRFRHRSRVYTYSYKANLGLIHIRRKKGVFGRVDFRISEEEVLEIGIRHRGLRLTIDLTELKQLN